MKLRYLLCISSERTNTNENEAWGVYKATARWQIFLFYKFSKMKDIYNHFKAPVSFNVLIEE